MFLHSQQPVHLPALKDPLDYFSGHPVALTPAAFIDTDRLILLGGAVRAVNDSTLAVFTGRKDTLLMLVDIPTGKIRKRMISIGRGPGEMTMAQICYQFDKSKLLVADPNQGIVFDVDIVKAVTEKSYRIEPAVRIRTVDLLKIDTCYVGSGSLTRTVMYRNHVCITGSPKRIRASPIMCTLPDYRGRTRFISTIKCLLLHRLLRAVFSFSASHRIRSG